MEVDATVAAQIKHLNHRRAKLQIARLGEMKMAQAYAYPRLREECS